MSEPAFLFKIILGGLYLAQDLKSLLGFHPVYPQAQVAGRAHQGVCRKQLENGCLDERTALRAFHTGLLFPRVFLNVIAAHFRLLPFLFPSHLPRPCLPPVRC